MMSKPSVSVLIISWNTSALLRSCLDSLAASYPGKAIEVVIVDNASTDGSPGIVKSEYLDALLIETGSNVGYSKAINRGLESCTAEFACLLNSDAAMTERSLETMIDYLRSHPGVGLLGPALVNADGTPQSSIRSFPFLSRLAARSLMRLPKDDASLQAQTADWLVGACLVLPRRLLEQLGGMDEDYPFYGEDMDLAFRVHREGLEVVRLGAARVVHVGEASSQSEPTPLMRVRSAYEAPLRFLLKHGGRLDLISWRLTRGLAAAARYIRARVMRPGPGAERQRAIWSRVIHLCFTGLPDRWTLVRDVDR
jgi:GT2 family glycosyltransferase